MVGDQARPVIGKGMRQALGEFTTEATEHTESAEKNAKRAIGI
jgi:hypothetical protein